LPIYFCVVKRHNMKSVLKELIQSAKEDPKEFFTSLFTIATIFGLFYVMIWFGAIIEGRV